ncbi:Methanophenazine hydrogenase maturation protease [Methanosarcina horonobensis HB-1 = JCM 15518]|uniref:Methanophenazine hydrogenase maturation protease n=2 Tax=Methanosarcina horonobensis TaxID=418008 RepID=A0A0E3SF20_9EURY|nr:Methanophenazine hydrogenase maturation protease [Methanosarcina horonobensis HB-1 = JCM 15518]
MGDDGIGIRIIEALKKTDLEGLEGLDIADAGVCGLDLLNLLDGARKVIIVDAVLTGSRTGSVHRIEGKDLLEGTEPHTLVSVHDLTITDVLRIGEQIQSLPEVVVIGIEIGEVATEISTDINPEVLEAVDEAIRLIREEFSHTL